MSVLEFYELLTVFTNTYFQYCTPLTLLLTPSHHSQEKADNQSEQRQYEEVSCECVR